MLRQGEAVSALSCARNCAILCSKELICRSKESKLPLLMLTLAELLASLGVALGSLALVVEVVEFDAAVTAEAGVGV